MRHSCAHVMADAVTQLFPGAKVTIGPCIDNGFYYDFEYEKPFTPEDLEKIENQINAIIKEDLVFIRKEISRKEAIDFFDKRGERFKVEIIQTLPEGEQISLYEHGGFTDLCKGPHLERTGQIKAFKLLSVAGSYWRGDEKRERLQRIYGTAFSNKKDLKDHLEKLEEAKKRDHRKLGRELELFTFHEEAPAMPFFYPKGALVYRLMVDYLRKLYVREGYQEVITPEILDVALWERSGHLEHFKENMYFTEIENRQTAVKPMNCPGHCLLFGERKWSYRELPVRFADFGRLHRYERSGVTHGLTRVRSFCQDDAHIYCMASQMDLEIAKFIALVREVYGVFGFSQVQVGLSTRPEKSMGSKELWESAEKKLEDALQAGGLDYTINKGEGAFYGPKIEFLIKDALGRPWQLGTLQVDYSMPERFGLNYISQEGKPERPVMLHRAILGSMERFFGIYLEHCAGAFPLWLAPVQILLVPITDNQHAYAHELVARLREEGWRAEVDQRNEKLGLKIREAQLKKVPFMAILGDREVADQSLSLRHRKDGDLGTMNLTALMDRLRKGSVLVSDHS